MQSTRYKLASPGQNDGKLGAKFSTEQGTMPRETVNTLSFSVSRGNILQSNKSLNLRTIDLRIYTISSRVDSPQSPGGPAKLVKNGRFPAANNDMAAGKRPIPLHKGPKIGELIRFGEKLEEKNILATSFLGGEAAQSANSTKNNSYLEDSSIDSLTKLNSNTSTRPKGLDKTVQIIRRTVQYEVSRVRCSSVAPPAKPEKDTLALRAGNFPRRRGGAHPEPGQCTLCEAPHKYC